MKSFNSLDIEKQDQIINGAMYVFAKNGYKKAYMSEIADRADITKPTLFYYFKSKLKLYEYLVDICYRYIEQSVIDVPQQQVDFFDGLEQVANSKIAALKSRPSITRFISSVYFEQDSNAQVVKAQFIERTSSLQHQVLVDNLNISNFKPGIDSDIVMKLLEKWTTGYIADLEKQADTLTDVQMSEYYQQMQDDFNQLIKLLKCNFYQE